MPVEIDAQGWLAGARRAPSPHANERPVGAEIGLVVVHGVSLPPGEFGGPWVEDFFTGRLDFTAHEYFGTIRDLHVAPHLLVRRDGETVQFVSFLRRAWHAGRSVWRGREECNDYSIGIELEGADTIPYTDAQYLALARILPVLIAAWPGIRKGGVVGHADVAPGRKTDPGPAFDWQRLDVALGAAGYNLVAGNREGERA
ncbi:MAG: 1,6-anhydro-N-acetylmuramyl-L-alanine amidase AmpD [Gammaproteobacteria bacterium]